MRNDERDWQMTALRLRCVQQDEQRVGEEVLQKIFLLTIFSASSQREANLSAFAIHRSTWEVTIANRARQNAATSSPKLAPYWKLCPGAASTADADREEHPHTPV
eukprot:RCo023313